MKTFIKIAFVAAFTAIAAIGVYTSQKTDTISDLALANVEALADSSEGCISKSGENDGDCTTDGAKYFCENSFWIDDCVKGQYPN